VAGYLIILRLDENLLWYYTTKFLGRLKVDENLGFEASRR
jgi:hypothetical protein